MQHRRTQAICRTIPHTFGQAALGITHALLFGVLVLSSGCTASQPTTQAIFQATLESWVVLGQGRHLRLVIEDHSISSNAPIVIEFTTSLLRADYTPPDNPERGNRLARMTLGDVLQPFFDNDSLRTEATYTITREQYDDITRDRVYATQYFLLGPNSNSALRDCLQDANLILPDHVLTGGGPLGAFPGIEFEAGPELPRSQWPAYGISGKLSTPCITSN